MGQRLTAREVMESQVREQQLQREVSKLFELTGWLTYHTHDSRRSESGFPDLVAIRHGVLLIRELKTRTGRVSGDQRCWLDALADVRVVDVGSDEIERGVWRPRDMGLIREKAIGGKS